MGSSECMDVPEVFVAFKAVPLFCSHSCSGAWCLWPSTALTPDLEPVTAPVTRAGG